MKYSKLFSVDFRFNCPPTADTASYFESSLLVLGDDAVSSAQKAKEHLLEKGWPGRAPGSWNYANHGVDIIGVKEQQSVVFF